SQARENGRLGHNWDHSYNEYVVRRPNGDVAYFSGAGRRDVFVRNGDGSFTSPAGFFGVLRAQPDGTLIYRTPDGLKRHFGPMGRLFCHEDRFGNRMTFEYDSRGDLELV